MAIQKISSTVIGPGAVPSETIATGAITAADIPDGEITAAKLHNTLDLSSKTVTLPTDGISGNSIHGGVISAFSSTGIDDNASSTALTITSGGNVGIGTGSPGAKLDVRGSSIFLVNATNPTAWVSVDSALTTGSMYNQWNTTSNVGISGTYTNHAYTFVTNNNERMRIDSSGNVGIGTNNPGYKLHVAHDGEGVTFDSTTYNILTVNTDSNDDQTSTDGIIKITNGAARVTKAEMRWDESENLAHFSYGDHGRQISIGPNDNVGVNTGSEGGYWKGGFNTDRNSISVPYDGTMVNVVDADGIVSFQRRVFASFTINFANGDSNRSCRFYFGNGDGFCNIYATVRISGTYAFENSMGYRIYEIARMANSGAAVFVTEANELHSAGPITTNIALNGWGFNSSLNKHYIELRHLKSTGNPYTVDFEFYGFIEHNHIKYMNVQNDYY